jgi:hypothetical protein
MTALDLCVLILYIGLTVAYIQLGFHARRHFDRSRLSDMEVDEASLFWYPFAWPFYDLYKPTALRIRLAGKVVMLVGVLVALARNWT